MADPVLVPCAKDAWTIVAANVSAGNVWMKDTTPKYLMTYVMTGGAAPVGLDKSVSFDDPGAPITADPAAPIDVYIYAKNATGLVEVWLP